eukprot:1161929-Pelagomonas_calceolata.AAC.9
MDIDAIMHRFPDLTSCICNGQKKDVKLGERLLFSQRNGIQQLLTPSSLTYNYAVASAVTHRTDPLVPDGAFMLGGEQNCFNLNNIGSGPAACMHIVLHRYTEH